MAKILERRISLDGEDDYLDVRLFFLRGRVAGLVLNYTAVIAGAPVVVCRYDTCHGHLHVHRCWLEENEPQDLEDPTRPAKDYGERLAIAEHDLLTNWKTYRTRMELKHR